MLDNMQQKFNLHMLEIRQNIFAVTAFCKSLVFFVIVKIMLIWNVSISIHNFHEFVPSTSTFAFILFSPAAWASKHLSLFYLFSIVLLLLILFLKWNYITGSLFFLFVFNLFQINTQIMNGSDGVLMMLSFWAIGMSARPMLKNERGNTLLILIFNVSVLLCQLQIVLVYFASGWDKLNSDVWRTGDAMSYIVHIDYLFNWKWFTTVDNTALNYVLSWLTILFELTFGIFIWLKRTRLIILLIGVAFHLIIWFMLSLPDFALVMIISYLIFLKDSDYHSLRKKFKLRPL